MSLLARRAAMMGKHARLPKEYQEVEWVEGDGTAYIITDILTSPSTRMTLDIMYYRQGANTLIYGYRSASSGWSWYISNSASETRNNVNISTTVIACGNVDFESRKRYDISVDAVMVDGVNYGSIQVASIPSGSEFIVIFGFSDRGNPQGNNCRIYANDFYESNVLTHSFVPCYRKADGEIGMYDTIADVFYTNSAGAGAFTKGADV